MDLERVAAVIRPRTPWEAVDLGFGMVRAWWKPIWGAWLVTVAPAWWLVWCLTWLISGEPMVAVLVVWWLRPLFDRVPLYVVSRHLFGASPSARNVLADLRQLWTRNLWAALTLQRLDPARSFDLPVWELEGLRGSERKARTALLQRVSRQNAVWLTFGCSILEIFALLSFFELISFLTPSSGWSEAAQMAELGAETGELTTAFWWWTAALSFLALTAIEPFYVAGGFSLYLSRRIHLEGWDVELAFRRLAARLTGGGSLRRKGGRAAVVIMMLLFGAAGTWAQPADPHPRPLSRERERGAGYPRTAQHQSPTNPHPSPARGRGAGGEGLSAPGEAIREVLAQPEFQTRKKMKVWRPKDKESKTTSEPPAPEKEASGWTGPSLGFLQPLVIAAAVLLLLGLIVVAVKGLRFRRSPSIPDDETGRAPLPAAVFGLDIRPESMPDDVPATAWNAWERGDPAAALGLLYRAALASLVRGEGLPVRESWTEGDCVDFVRRKTGAELSAYFDRLTRAWQSTAYAHRPPSPDEARALCGAWGRHFGEAA